MQCEFFDIEKKKKKRKKIKPPPLMFSWEIYAFFKVTEAAIGGVP